MTEAPFFRRQEHLGVVGSTNDIVREWLATGEPEVCLAVADEQSAGRGRAGRRWVAPAGTALLLSVGFRPRWLAPERTWRLAATVSLAMADAAEEVAGLPEGAIRLKWPNDLVIEVAGPASMPIGQLDPSAAAGRLLAPLDMRKLGGVLGETDGLGGPDPIAVVGIGVNADWAGHDFPPDLAATMTSLRESSGGRPIDLALLLDAFTGRLEARVEALRGGYFDVAGWVGRQATTGREIRLLLPDDSEETVRALAVDPVSGALVVADAGVPDGERQVLSAEIVQTRLMSAVGV